MSNIEPTFRVGQRATVKATFDGPPAGQTGTVKRTTWTAPHGVYVELVWVELGAPGGPIPLQVNDLEPE